MHRIINADCLDAMAAMEPNSIDAIVTDPPYGLSFMGKDWDHGVPGEHFWVEAMRVAKPGAHLIAFGGTRTYHRLACAIEDAGWEVRDCLGWLYGSGFPKSHNISKALDKAAGAERDVVGVSDRQAAGYVRHGRTDEEVWLGTDGNRTPALITAPATDLARQWDGWGTALKPAWEPAILARKPLIGTVAANVTEYGTGGLNIDGCRVDSGGEDLNGGAYRGDYNGRDGSAYNLGGKLGEYVAPAGRFPANICHDGSDEVLGVFPSSRSAGDCPSGSTTSDSVTYNSIPGQQGQLYADGGSAARFFYCAKASKRDRNDGLPDGERCTHPTVKPTDLMRWLVRLVTPPNGVVLDPFMGSGSTGKAAVLEGFDFIGVDLSAEYCAIAEARIADAEAQRESEQPPLF